MVHTSIIPTMISSLHSLKMMLIKFVSSCFLSLTAWNTCHHFDIGIIILLIWIGNLTMGRKHQWNQYWRSCWLHCLQRLWWPQPKVWNSNATMNPMAWTITRGKSPQRWIQLLIWRRSHGAYGLFHCWQSLSQVDTAQKRRWAQPMVLFQKPSHCHQNF